MSCYYHLTTGFLIIIYHLFILSITIIIIIYIFISFIIIIICIFILFIIIIRMKYLSGHHLRVWCWWLRMWWWLWRWMSGRRRSHRRILPMIHPKQKQKQKRNLATSYLNLIDFQLTGKNPCGMGPPGMPSPGAICPSGLGTGPAFYVTTSNDIHQHKYTIANFNYNLNWI